MKFLTADEKDELRSLLEHTEGMKALWKCLDYCSSRREEKLVKFILNPTNLPELGFLKAQAEGARLLVADLKQLFDTHKNSKSE
jgi:hypothetical protein